MILCKDGALSDCGVGLIEIHLAFYQMNPWVTPLRSFINLWKPQVRFSNFLHFLLTFHLFTPQSFAFAQLHTLDLHILYMALTKKCS